MESINQHRRDSHVAAEKGYFLLFVYWTEHSSYNPHLHMADS